MNGWKRDLRTVVISVAAASLIVGVPAMAATRVANSHRVDGKHAVSAKAAKATRAGKLVATGRTGFLPNNIILKAGDANKLDGKDSTAYLSATGKAVDSAKFNGFNLSQVIEAAKGATGSAGPVGPRGATGSAGPVGPRGTTGVGGATGLKGPTGITGDVGPAGPQGSAGLKGNTGADGVPGVTGERGLQGLTGATGERGLQGLPGPTGAAGPQGLPGISNVLAIPIASGRTITTSGTVLATGLLSFGRNYVVTGAVTARAASNGGLQCQLTRQGTSTWDDMAEMDLSQRSTVALEHAYPGTATGVGYYAVFLSCISSLDYVVDTGHLYATQVGSISSGNGAPVAGKVPESLRLEGLQ